MIKGLYITTEDINDTSSGVAKKIRMQCEAFERNGFCIKLISFPRIIDFKDRITRFIPFYKREYVVNIYNKLKEENLINYDFVYVRYILSGYDSLKIYKYIKQKNNRIKIICEFPTFPYDNELKKIQFYPVLIKDLFCRHWLKKYIDLSTTYSNETSIHGIPCIELFNGFHVSTVNPLKKNYKKDNFFNIIGVGRIAPWHGYDRVIKGIKRYYEKGGLQRIRFHIVGSGRYISDLKELVKRLKITDSIIFHGDKSGADLLDLYALSDIGIGSLNARVMGCNHVSPLKTREYCALGIPFLFTPFDYIFSDCGFQFALECKDDNEDIHIDELIYFINNLHKKYSDEEITNKMREFVEEQLSWDKSLYPVFLYIKDYVNSAVN